jgi:hypothetical protein
VYADKVLPQPPNKISKLVGFNLNVKIYEALTPLATMELVHGVDQLFDWDHQKNVLTGCLSSVKRILDNVPKELTLNTREDISSHREYHSIPNPTVSRSNGYHTEQSPPEGTETTSQIQFEIQKANILVSQLSTRSYLVEKLWNLQEAQSQLENAGLTGALGRNSDGGMPKAGVPASDLDALKLYLNAERETIVKELLVVLRDISQVNMEPNGGSFVSFISHIISFIFCVISSLINSLGFWRD